MGAPEVFRSWRSCARASLHRADERGVRRQRLSSSRELGRLASRRNKRKSLGAAQQRNSQQVRAVNSRQARYRNGRTYLSRCWLEIAASISSPMPRLMSFWLCLFASRKQERRLSRPTCESRMNEQAILSRGPRTSALLMSSCQLSCPPVVLRPRL